MPHPFTFLFDGTLQRELSPSLLAAGSGWLGLLLLVLAGVLAVAVDLHRQGARDVVVAAAGDRVAGGDGPVGPAGQAARLSGRRVRLAATVLTVALTALALGATLVRFADLTS